ncbi:MAG TPA: HEAT repeat domain-containing protein [Polyangiales bacterium]|nr:HEAT repeat domain-containing protein [Polyangiales bacterium]
MTGHIGRWHGWRALIVVTLLFANGAAADAREDYLVRLLRTSEAFRVRAQAALSLGQLESTRSSIRALERALADAHPAVRVAAISSLRRLEAKQSLPVVEKATRDRDKAVRRAAKEAVEALQSVGQRPHGPGPTRYLVAMGMPGTKAERVSRQMLFDARIFLAEQLQQLEGVELAPDDLSPAEAKREIVGRKLHGIYLESSVVSLEPKGDAVRAVVTIVVLTYPGREMRGMLRGAATASGGYDGDIAEQAIQGAFLGALRRLPTVMETVRAKGSL